MTILSDHATGDARDRFILYCDERMHRGLTRTEYFRHALAEGIRINLGLDVGLPHIGVDVRSTPEPGSFARACGQWQYRNKLREAATSVITKQVKKAGRASVPFSLVHASGLDLERLAADLVCRVDSDAEKDCWIIEKLVKVPRAGESGMLVMA